MNRRRIVVIAALVLLALATLPPQAPAQVVNEVLLNGLTYRNLGPFRAGAWTVAVDW